MKNKILQNAEAISELGILTASFLKLQKMPLSADDPLAAYQKRIQHWNDNSIMLIDIAAEEIGGVVNSGRKLSKVVFAGYEAILMDRIVKQIDSRKKIIVIPNNPEVNQKRITMNHAATGNFSVHEIYPVWEITGHETIVFIPFFELTDGSVWVYRYCAPIINQQLFSKARSIVGVMLLNELQIEAGYDSKGTISLLAEADPNIFKSIITVGPKTIHHEFVNSTHSA